MATDLQRRTIMVVEDSFYLAADVARVLRAAGAQVLGPFPDSAAATAAVEHQPPDVAILDINLEDGISLELARLLRARAIPFLFFTGYDASAIPSEFSHVLHLQKPVDPVRLVQAVHEVHAARPA